MLDRIAAAALHMHRAVKMSRVIKPDSCDVQIFSPGHKFNQYFGNIDNRNLLQGR